ncbi:MAG: type II toxin-antitoxin system VapC family toxin [Polyangiaceae bacterium]|nr:type II toxin-antitoxin system VapC family toxin [Polyangiaceae bacterium]
MRLLLDTQCWQWMVAASRRLGKRTRALLLDAGNELFLSSASAWEIAIKHALGRLPLPLPPAEYVPSRMLRSGTQRLAIHHGHALRAGALPPLHRDPFDRLLVAQAETEKLTLISADRVLERYGVAFVRADA